MSCPKCGADDAVPKAEAWDALCSIPPAVQKELDRLRSVEQAVKFMLRESKHRDGHNPKRNVDAQSLEALALVAECQELLQ